MSTASLENMPPRKPKPTTPTTPEMETAREMVRQAREAGMALTGPGGLMAALTKMVVETALEEEITDHLGYEHGDHTDRSDGNQRNGKRTKTVVSESSGEVTVEVPRDRNGTFEPVIVKKRQRRLNGVDEVVLSLYAKGLTTGDISAHFEEIYGVSVSKDTISRITDKVVAEMQDWQTRPLDKVYAAVFIDALVVKVRDGQVANRPIYAAIGVDLDGNRDILGLWAGQHGDGETARFWLQILTELKNRGITDVFFLVCDGLKGLPNSVAAVWPNTIVQTCVIHLIRNSHKYVPRQHRDKVSTDLKAIYTAINEPAAAAALETLSEKWGGKYPALVQVWRNAWNEFVPFLDYDLEIRRVICSTNAIESLNARFRRTVRARGHFPTEQAAMKCLYLVVRSLDPTGNGRAKWVQRWKPALNAFAIVFADRMPNAEHH